MMEKGILLASVICVYNDTHVLNEQLLKSINNQVTCVELILIDNTEQKYKSAVEALEYGISISTADVLVFIHQDVFIKDKEGLINFINVIKNGRIGDIFGVAGSIEGKKQNVGLYTSGAKYTNHFAECNWSIMRVSCLDECMFGMRRDTYFLHPFNGMVCDNWHMYCAEMCFHARRDGYSIWLVPIPIHHYSNGRITEEYMNCLKKVSCKYREDFKYIWTTAYKVRSSKLYVNSLVAVWKVNRIIRDCCFWWTQK